MDGTPRRRWLRWGNVVAVLVLGVLGVGASVVPAQAAQTRSESGVVDAVGAPVVALSKVPSTHRVDVLTGRPVNAPVVASSGVHPMLVVLGGVIAGFVLVISALLLLPVSRRRRAAGVSAAGLDHRHACVAGRAGHIRLQDRRT